jgi:GNAT superfamily N-acetyltransferase
MSGLFAGERTTAFELGAADMEDVQRLFEATPSYFQLVLGEPPAPDAARKIFERLPPDGWAYTRKWSIGWRDASGALAAMADVVEDLLAPAVWHLGLFIVAGPLHGTGVARDAYDALESWIGTRGARFLRLGVVDGNVRAERFWRSRGYVEVQRRGGVAMGRKTHTLFVMAKPVGTASLDGYRALVRGGPSGES